MLINNHTLILVAMRDQFFDRIERETPELKMAGMVIYLKYPLIIEAKSYVLHCAFEKIGIDLRLFNKLYQDDIIYRMDLKQERIGSITEKVWELATEETARYVAEHLRTTEVFLTVFDYHSWLNGIIRDNQTENGINLEFGVANGDSIRKLADKVQNTFYGFDSFEGLPEDWYGSNCQGTFKTEGLPEVPDNVELMKGWYDTTCPIFADRKDITGRRADFIHIDCDLYSSTKTVFDNMGKFIKKGTIIAFDEYFNYPGWKLDEYKAFQEFVKNRNVQYEYLAYVDRACQVCVRILEID